MGHPVALQARWPGESKKHGVRCCRRSFRRSSSKGEGRRREGHRQGGRMNTEERIARFIESELLRVPHQASTRWRAACWTRLASSS